jgi:predicted nucleic-acid-binding protein
MHAVDTNVLVRLLVQDDPAQSERARRLFERETIFLPKTVLVETEWVLRRLYGFDSTRLAGALGAAAALENVRCEDATAVHLALQAYARGMDFADALHVASSASADAFATFDSGLIKRAKKFLPLPVVSV